MPTRCPPKLLEVQLFALETALQQHGFWHKGRIVLPFTAVIEAVWPEEFREPPGPDVAFTAPGNTSERLEELVARAEANSPLFPPTSRDLDVLERLGVRLKAGHQVAASPDLMAANRKHFEVVVETHEGPQEPDDPDEFLPP